MQGVPVVIGVATGVVKDIPPTQETEEVQEKLVQEFRSKDGSMNKLVARNAAQEGSHGSVEEQPDDNANPDLLQPEEIGQGAGQEKQRQVTAGLVPALQIAAPGKFPKLGASDGAPVPLDPKVFSHVSQRRIAHAIPSSGWRTKKLDMLRSRTRLVPRAARVNIGEVTRYTASCRRWTTASALKVRPARTRPLRTGAPGSSRLRSGSDPCRPWCRASPGLAG